MKRVFTIALLCVLAGVALILFFGRSRNTSLELPDTNSVNSSPRIENQASASRANGAKRSDTLAPSSTPNNTPVATPAPTSALIHEAGMLPVDTNSAPDLPQRTISEQVRRAVHQYGDMFGGNPVGTNPEITAQLTGKNPKQINFLSNLPGVQIDADGDLLDSWGTPYFFHQLSATDMEIHSAGPDKRMWTSDDIVVR